MDALKACPHCRALISVRARQCPYCEARTDLAPVEVAASPSQAVHPARLLALWLVLFNVVYYIAMMAFDPRREPGPQGFFAAPSDPALLAFGIGHPGRAEFLQEWWRLGTAMLIHLNFLHLALNSICIWIAARPAQQQIGVVRTLGIYVATGLAGAVASHFIGGNPGGGASGALCGLVGALLAVGKRRGGPDGEALFRWMASWAFLILIWGLAQKDVIDNYAHGGGFVVGFGLGWLAAARHATPRQVLVWRAVALLGIAVLAVCVFLMVRFAVGFLS